MIFNKETSKPIELKFSNANTTLAPPCYSMRIRMIDNDFSMIVTCDSCVRFMFSIICSFISASFSNVPLFSPIYTIDMDFGDLRGQQAVRRCLNHVLPLLNHFQLENHLANSKRQCIFIGKQKLFYFFTLEYVACPSCGTAHEKTGFKLTFHQISFACRALLACLLAYN